MSDNEFRYPPWFNVYRRPEPPKIPSPTLWEPGEFVDSYEIFDGDPIDFREGLIARLEVYGDTYKVEYYHEDKEIENPNYAAQILKYNEDYKAFLLRDSEWTELKKKHDKYEWAKQKEQRRQQFEELKKEFGS